MGEVLSSMCHTAPASEGIALRAAMQILHDRAIGCCLRGSVVYESDLGQVETGHLSTLTQGSSAESQKEDRSGLKGVSSMQARSQAPEEPSERILQQSGLPAVRAGLQPAPGHTWPQPSCAATDRRDRPAALRRGACLQHALQGQKAPTA